MRDRLQAVGCLKEIINQIGERSPSDVEEFYGEGLDMKILHKWTNSF